MNLVMYVLHGAHTPISDTARRALHEVELLMQRRLRMNPFQLLINRNALSDHVKDAKAKIDHACEIFQVSVMGSY